MSDSLSHNDAPGHPGIGPTWSSSAKDALTSALGTSRVWATIGRGILNEVYWPSTGRPQIRDLGFLVSWPGGWTEVKRHDRYRLTFPEPYAPVPSIVHESSHFRLELEVVCDDVRDCVLIRYSLDGVDARLYALLAPRMGVQGIDNTAWADDELHAVNSGDGLCLACNGGFSRTSAGFVGESDGWQDFARHKRMEWTWPRAPHGNVALMGELRQNEGVLALSFSDSAEGATTLARSSLACDFNETRDRVVEKWRAWISRMSLSSLTQDLRHQFLLSAVVLKLCEDRTYPGAVVASLSVPWGNSRDDLGGYHLVWARDCVSTGLGMLATGQSVEARSMLAYLAATQSEDGHWTQNFYPDGTAYWTGVQLDEAGFPILLAAKLRERNALDGLLTVKGMVRRAARFLVRNGPITQQDRWEENEGLNPFTLAVQVAALVAAADFLDDDAERSISLAMADYLNERIEDWTYAEDTPLAQKYAVPGHYVRIAPRSRLLGEWGDIVVKNGMGESKPATSVVALDFLYLARLGLRAPQDPAIVSSLKAAEGEIGVDTPSGRCYYRYNGDGYGEREDGLPFNGTGRGRPWPLLTGERGHFALLQGEDVSPYLESMMRMAGRGGLLPEQIWDAAPIPRRDLRPGKPTGSAMPLLWAHAEFLKLAAAQGDRRPIEMLDVVQDRYQGRRPRADAWRWREDMPFPTLPPGRAIVFERYAPFELHYGFDGWQDVQSRQSEPIGFDLHGARLDPQDLSGRSRLDFTWRDQASGAWRNADFFIQLAK
jgi:glucoamylase